MILVVAGALIADGQVLAARRGPTMKLAGQWELPGGKVETGESEPSALARELEEELGIEVQVGVHLGRSEHGRICLSAWVCALRRGTPTLTEHDAMRWLGPDELDQVDWAQADIPLLAPLREHLRGLP